VGRQLIPADAECVKALIARLYLGAVDAGGSTKLGSITLLPHQCEAVARVRRAIGKFGGAILADEVGMGKTYVALAIASQVKSAVVVAPAVLRDMWMRASLATQTHTRFASYEQLSRGTLMESCDLCILDEAHHLRNPRTRRYDSLVRSSVSARVLALTATPIHNDVCELQAVLALFLGAAAATATEDILRACIIRREHGAVRMVPDVARTVMLDVTYDPDELDRVVSLPHAVPIRDGGAAHALETFSLVRQWCSTKGAFREALRRRLASSLSMISSLESGRYPSREELRRWSYADNALQLAMPELLISSVTLDARELLITARSHAGAIQELLASVKNNDARDQERVDHLRMIRQKHSGEKIVVFSQFAASVAALFRVMRADPGVAALTSRAATIAGGRLTRREALDRFAPNATGAPVPAVRDRIDLLLTTDLASEGINLQDASVVVHIDLPWTAARLAQRVGRVARIGAARSTVSVYAISPPAPGEQLLGLEARLRKKAGAMASHIGPLAFFDSDSERASESPIVCEEKLRLHLQGWLSRDENNSDVGQTSLPALVATVRAKKSGIVALYSDGVSAELIGGDGPTLRDDACVISQLLADIDDGCAATEQATLDRCCASEADGGAIEVMLSSWEEGRAAGFAIGLDVGAVAQTRRKVLQRLDSVVRCAPTHQRPAFLRRAARIRSAITGIAGAGIERLISSLAGADAPDAEWLRNAENLILPLELRPREDLLLRAVLVLQGPSSTDG
jgi:superfamily II DNA or RNA helicase